MSREFSFESLIAPVRARDFYDHFWERQPLLIRRQAPSYYQSIFTLDDVDRYVLAGKDTTRDVTIVPPPDRGQSSRRVRLHDVSMDQMYDAFVSGETIRLESIQEAWPPVASLAGHVGGALGTGVNVNLYMTPANSQGLSVHFDTHDVFILQVDGAKEWWLYESEVELPVEVPTYLKHLGAVGEKKVQEDPARLIQHGTLETGDLLYIPRGFPHKAVTRSRQSVHLAVAIAPVFWVDLLRTAVERLCIDRRELRRALPLGFLDDADIRAAVQTELASLLRASCETASSAEALDVLIQDRVTACRYPPDGHFSELARLDTLTAREVVERRPGMKCIVTSSPDDASIHFAMNQVRGPKAIAAALEHVRDHHRFRVGDLPGSLSDDSKVLLVRRLIREGLLRRVSCANGDVTREAVSRDNIVPILA